MGSSIGNFSATGCTISMVFSFFTSGLVDITIRDFFDVFLFRSINHQLDHFSEKGIVDGGNLRSRAKILSLRVTCASLAMGRELDRFIRVTFFLQFACNAF